MLEIGFICSAVHDDDDPIASILIFCANEARIKKIGLNLNTLVCSVASTVVDIN